MYCKYCNRELKNPGGLSVHESACLSNPNRKPHPRSPLAGRKPGIPSWNKGKKFSAEQKLALRRYSNDEMFIEDGKVARHHVKKRILEEHLIEYKCCMCGLGPEWQNKPMPLILDHINGKNNDNRLQNLRFVCSNCDTQLPTYKSKNIG